MDSLLNVLIASNNKKGVKSKVKKPKSSADLRRSILELAAQENVGVPAERQVTHRMAMTVASRTLEETKSLPMESRVFAAYKAVGRFVSLAINGETENNKARHTDLLPIGHPCSTRRHGMTASAYRMTSARWYAADPRVDDSVRALVASAIYYQAGTVEQLHAMKRIEALTAGAVPRDIVLTALVAVGGNSSAAKSLRVKFQLRNRDGEWIEMGGGIGFDLELPDGSVAPVVGKSAGGSYGNPEAISVVVKNDPNVPDGIYEVPASKVRSVKAILPDSAVKGLKTPAAKTTAGNKYTVRQSEFIAKTEPDGWDVKPEGSFELANGRAADEVFTSPDGYEVLKWNNVDNKVASHLGKVAKGSKPGETSIPVAGAMPSGKLDPKQPVYLLRRTEGGPGVKKAVGIAQDWADVQKLAGDDQDKYEKDKQGAADTKIKIKKSQQDAAEAKGKSDSAIQEEKNKLNQSVNDAIANGTNIDGSPLPEGWSAVKGKPISQDKNDGIPSKESLLVFEKNQDGVTLTATQKDDGTVAMDGKTYKTFEEANDAAPGVAKDKAAANRESVLSNALDAVKDYDPDGDIAEMIKDGASADEVFARLGEDPNWNNAKEDYDSRGFVDSPKSTQTAQWAETGRQVKSIEALQAGRGLAKRDSLNDIANSIEENAPFKVRTRMENYQGNEFLTVIRESDGKETLFGLSYAGQPRPGETIESTEYVWNEPESNAVGEIPLEIRDADGIAKEFWKQAEGSKTPETLAKRDSLKDIANSIEKNAPYKVKAVIENYQGNEFVTITRESDGKQISFGLAYGGQPRPGETIESTEYAWNENEGDASGDIPLDIRDADGIANEFWEQFNKNLTDEQRFKLDSIIYGKGPAGDSSAKSYTVDFETLGDQDMFDDVPGLEDADPTDMTSAEALQTWLDATGLSALGVTVKNIDGSGNTPRVSFNIPESAKDKFNELFGYGPGELEDYEDISDSGVSNVRDRIKKESEKLRDRAADLALEIDNQIDEPSFNLKRAKELVTDALNTLDKVSRGQTDKVINDGLISANVNLTGAERFMRDAAKTAKTLTGSNAIEEALVEKIRSLKIDVNDLWKSGRKSDGDDPDMEGVEGPDDDLNYKYKDVRITKDFESGLWKIEKPVKPSGLIAIKGFKDPVSLKEVKERIDKAYADQNWFPEGSNSWQAQKNEAGKPSSSSQGTSGSKPMLISTIEDLAGAYKAKLIESSVGKSFDAGDYGVGQNADGTYDIIGPNFEDIATNVESASEVKKIIDDHAAANGLSTSSEQDDSGDGDNSGNAGGDTGQGDSTDDDEVTQTNELDFEPDVPKNGYKMNLTTFLPEGPDADMAPDYTEDPAVLANKFSEDILKDALVEGLVGVKDAGAQMLEDLLGTPDDDEEEAPVKKKPGPKKKGPKKEVKGSGSAPLTFGEGEDEYVPVEAIFLALREKGIDADALVAEIYDTYSPKDEDGNSTTNNVAALAQARGQGKTSVTALDVTTSRDDSQAVELYPASKPLTRMLADLASKEEQNQKLIDIADQVKAFAFSPYLDDELYVELLNTNIGLAYSDDENDKEAFAALWSMLLFLDGGETNFETYYVEGGFPGTSLSNSVATAVEKYTGNDAPNEYLAFFDKHGMFNEGDNKDFYTSRIRIADGSEDPMDPDSAAGPFYRLLAQFKDTPHVELYRGISVDSDDPILAKIETLGAVLDIDGRSFTSDKLISGFSSGAGGQDTSKTSVIFTLPEGKGMAMDVSKISMFENERERIVAGRFRITQVRKGVTPKGKTKYNVTIEPIEAAEEDTSTDLRDLIENEIFEMPEGYYDIDPSPYKMFDELGPDAPEGYTDDPVYIAENWDADDLAEVFTEAIRDGSGIGRLMYPIDGGFEANTSAEALRDALQLQGVDTNVLLEELSGETPGESAESEDSNVSEYVVDLTNELQEVFDISDWKKVGAAAGSNEGGFYENENGEKFYVKFAKSALHAGNEMLAAALYLGLGIDVPMVMQGLGANGELVTLTEVIEDAKSDLESKLEDPEYKKKVQDGFAIDAWLANWDVAGLVYDNVMTNADGDPVRVDPGGALLFRAMGSPKGGLFGDEVNELDTLRDSSMNPTSASIFGSMTDEQITESARRLLNISEDDIDALVDATIEDESTAEQLKSTLKARRDYILNRYGISEDEEPDADEEVEDVAVEEKAAPSAGDYKLPDGTPINIGDKYRYKKTGEIVEVVKYDPGNTGYVHVSIGGKKQNKSTKQLEAISSSDSSSSVDSTPAEQDPKQRSLIAGWLKNMMEEFKSSPNFKASKLKIAFEEGEDGDSIVITNKDGKSARITFDKDSGDYALEVDGTREIFPRTGGSYLGTMADVMRSLKSPKASETQTPPPPTKKGNPNLKVISEIKNENVKQVARDIYMLQSVNGWEVKEAGFFSDESGFAFVDPFTKISYEFVLNDGTGGDERGLKIYGRVKDKSGKEMFFYPKGQSTADVTLLGADYAKQVFIGLLNDQGSHVEKLSIENEKYAFLENVDPDVSAGDSDKKSKIKISVADDPETYEYLFSDTDVDTKLLDAVIAEFKDGLGSGEIIAVKEDENGQSVVYTVDGQRVLEQRLANVDSGKPGDYIGAINGTYGRDFYGTKEAREIGYNRLTEEQLDYLYGVIELRKPVPLVKLVKTDGGGIDISAQTEFEELLGENVGIVPELYNAVIAEFKDGLGSGQIIALGVNEDGTSQKIVYTLDGHAIYQRTFEDGKLEKDPLYLGPLGVDYAKSVFSGDTMAAAEEGFFNPSDEQLDFLHRVIEGGTDDTQEAPGGLKGASGETLLVGLVVTDKNGNTGTITKLKPESGYAMVQLADGSKKWRSAKTLSSTGQAAEVAVKPTKPKSVAIPKITPAGAPKVKSDEPVDWNESNFMEIPSLTGAITRVMSDTYNAGIAGASTAVDSDSIEDLDLRVMRVKDVDGSDGMMFKFRLTSWAGRAKRDALWKEMDGKTDVELAEAGIRVTDLSIPKIVLSEDSAQLSDFSAYSNDMGKTVEISLPNDIRIRLNFATGNITGKYGKPAAFDNTVSIYAPAGTDPKLIEEALTRAGVVDSRPATNADAVILIENRLMSIFDKQTDPKKNLKGEQRQESLQRIFDKYGVSSEDVEFTTGTNGRIETRLRPEAAEVLAKITGSPTHFKHDANMYSRVLSYDTEEEVNQKNSDFADRIVNVLAGPHGALLSTTARWSEGVGQDGQSSAEDIGVGSADYVFMTPRLEKYEDRLQPGYEYKGTGVSFYFNAVQMYERLDFYANKNDKYGKRVNGHDVLDEAKVSPSMFANPYEVMFKHRVGFDALEAVIVNQAVRTMVLQKLRQLGITEIGGKPIEQVIRVGGLLPDIDDL